MWNEFWNGCWETNILIRQWRHLKCVESPKQLSTATLPHPRRSSLSSAPASMCVCVYMRHSCCSFSCLLVWWWRDFVLFPFGSWTPPIPLPLFSHHLLVPRHLPLSSLPGVEYEREQPVLSRHKDRSCQQVVIATVSLSAATSLLGKRECGESQGPSLCSLAAQIRGVTVFFWHPFK